MTGRVVSITPAPVKGLGLSSVGEVELEQTGVPGDRRFHLIAADGRLVNGKLLGSLVQVSALAEPDGAALTLSFPDGTVVKGDVAGSLGAPVVTSFYGRPVPGRLVDGPLAEALSSFVGEPLGLVHVDEAGGGIDRGVGASVSVVSNGSLARLAREAGVERVDGRRFRMLFGIDQVDPHEEDDWVGRLVAFGEAVVRLEALVGRCAVTTQDPDTGIPDLDTLRVLAGYRGRVASKEPLPIGVWGRVERPGRVGVGDDVVPL